MADIGNILVDGISVLPDGMNSGIAPQLLQPSQTSFSTNSTHRGGFIRNRPGFRKVTLSFDGGLVTQQRFENTLWQGGAFFKSEYGTESLVCSIGGRLFEVVPNPDTSLDTAIVYDRTISNSGVDDTNSSGNAIAWVWQSERWMIINDGQSLPIFYDGQVARRSYGASQVVGTPSADFVAPAVGASVNITLAANYTGPYNTTVYIDDVFYQINSSPTGYEITLKNIGAITGATVAAGTLIQIPNNLLGYLTGGGAAPFYIPLVGQNAQSYAPANLVSECGFALGSVAILIASSSSISSQIVTITTSTGSFVTGNIRPFLTSTYKICLHESPGVILPVNAPIFSGYSGNFSIAGTVQNAFVVPAIGASTTVVIETPYNGTVPQQVVIGGFLYEITATNNTPAPSNVVSATNISDTAGTARGPSTPSTPGIISTVPELPVGKMGAYGMGRNWMTLADGRSFIASDIVGGSSGSPAVNYRDAVLKTTENSFLSGGGVFVVPGNVGDIQSMTFTANLDVSLGQGPLQIGTPTTIFSCQAPVDRTTWQTITNPILTESLKGKGPLGQYGTILVNSDTLFRAVDGLGSLILARRDFTSWGNVPISREMQRVIDEDDITLLGNSTAVQFDNRLLMGCLPFRGALGVYHQGFIALNFDPISSLRGKAASIYDGLWTGLQAFQIISGKFSGDERAFAFCYETQSNKIILSELAQSGEDEFDNSTIPITWSFETSSLFNNVKNKGQFDEVELQDGEIHLSDIQGIVNVQTWYRPSYSECWVPWKDFSVCGTPNTPKQYRSRIGLGMPSSSDCEPTNNRPYRIGNTFQIRVQITGACRVRGLLAKAARSPEAYWAKPVCNELCSVDSLVVCEPCKEQGNCLQFDLVFYNLNGHKVYSNDAVNFNVTCPDGTVHVVTVPAGTINYALPFPPDYTGDYPPLVLGCGYGGNIVRTVPSGSTQEEIDVIVNGMISECAQATAQGTVDCSGAVTQFSNAEVYFLHSCTAPEELSYSGTLPAWITLDTVNSRLVGAAGTFNASTQAFSNLIAQNAIDEFGNAALNLGTLACGCPTPVSFPTISTGGTTLGGCLAYHPGTQTLWQSANMSGLIRTLIVCSAVSNTVIQTIDLTAVSGSWDIIYDSVNDQMVVLSRNGSIVFVNPVTYATVTLAGILTASGVSNGSFLAYDPSRGNILAVEVFNPPTRIRLISGASKSQIASNDQVGVSYGTAVYCALNDKYYFSEVTNTTMKEINPTTLAISNTSVVFPNALEWMTHALYVEDLELIFIQTRENLTFKRVRVLDASTMTLVGTLSGADVPASWKIQYMAYNDCSQLLVTTDLTNTLKFNTSTFAEFSINPEANCVGVAFVHSSNLTYVSMDTTIVTL